ncbi:hypothetical protein FUAX_02280 [Fulvitalea axinellae]|uniref:Uncharacterized protein n=1 Tax=Fulvitalea axinellae TaxID=1182444 RepID=A0AAU9D4Q8_9BACT|nr:hypothetical protein FUAX_02280 [Fulvitalea axinellae]
MFQRRSLDNRLRRKEPAATSCSSVSPVQAMFHPVTLKTSVYGYVKHDGAMRRNPDIVLKAGQRAVIDDEKPVDVLYGDQEAGGEEDLVREKWFPSYVENVNSRFYLREDFFSFNEETHSFQSMIEFLREHTQVSRRELRRKLRTVNLEDDPLSRQLYHYHFTCAPKGRYTHGDQRRLYDVLLNIAESRPDDTGLQATQRGKKTVNCPKSKLRTSRRVSDALEKMFWDFSGNTKSTLALPPKTREMTRAKPGSAPVETREVPYQYKFYLNVMPAHVADVTRYILAMVDVPALAERPQIRKLRVGPIRGHATRIDNMCLTVATESGLRAVKAKLKELSEAHPEYFADETLFMAERLAPGISWGQSAYFMNVWTMEPAMVSSVRRFLGRVGDMLKKHDERWFTSFESSDVADRWDRLKRYHTKGVKEFGEEGDSVAEFSKSNLLKMNDLMMRFGGTGLSELPLKWLQFYEEAQPKMGAGPPVFLRHRMDALESVVKKHPRTMSKALRLAIAKLSEYNIDFGAPHLSREFEPFRDEDMVNINLRRAEEGSEGEEYADFQQLADEEEFVDRPDPKPKPKAKYKSRRVVIRALERVLDQASGTLESDEESSLTTVNIDTAKPVETPVLKADVERARNEGTEFLKEQHLPCVKEQAALGFDVYQTAPPLKFSDDEPIEL